MLPLQTKIQARVLGPFQMGRSELRVRTFSPIYSVCVRAMHEWTEDTQRLCHCTEVQPGFTWALHSVTVPYGKEIRKISTKLWRKLYSSVLTTS